MGYRSVEHQGWCFCRDGKKPDESPYPKGSLAHRDFMVGFNMRLLGESAPK